VAKVVEKQPQLLTLNIANLEPKVAALHSAALAVPRWKQQMEEWSPSTLGFTLAYATRRFDRLRQVAALGVQRVERCAMSSVLRYSDEELERRFPEL
jgi:hypothetical protein